MLSWRIYPFSAIVAQDATRVALLLNAVDPRIGGVLIRGPKGTGKSTAARAFGQLLPDIEVVADCPFNSDPQAPFAVDADAGSKPGATEVLRRPMPFVELPLNATEDRLVGTLHFERALATGRRQFEPGLLAAANRGILYVDEVNLLEDHLVDLLLDAAASGVNVVEREGLSYTHPARFLLIGTMNPEEGELRPQFLDRFGLCAGMTTIPSVDGRELIVRRHMDFERDPEAFLRAWQADEELVRQQIILARRHLDTVRVPDEILRGTVRLTLHLAVQGHRADLTLIKAARAHAALLEKSVVEAADIAIAAQLALPHRLALSPLDTPDQLQGRIDHALQQLLVLPTEDTAADADEEEPSGIGLATEGLEEMAERIQVPGACAAGSIVFSFLKKKTTETVVDADRHLSLAAVELEDLLAQSAGVQRHARRHTVAPRGRYRRAVALRPGEQASDIAWDATFRAAIRQMLWREPGRVGRWHVTPADLHRKQRIRPCERLIVFVVDASDSMGEGAEVRMRAAKGAVLAILRQAYLNRSRVALIAFGGEEGTVILPPTNSISRAQSCLRQLPIGGATPFASGLLKAWQLINGERHKRPGLVPILMVISDGEANVPLVSGRPPLAELRQLAARVKRERIPAVMVDVTTRYEKGMAMRDIASAMGASYLKVEALGTRNLLRALSADNLCENGRPLM
jgi:magnesium chelatase subunit D